MIVAYIDAYHHRFGVEPICRVLSEHDIAISPGTYYARRAQPVSDSDRGDAHMANIVIDLHRANRSVYGADKLWTAMRRAGHDIGRDQVARLMAIVGICGARRGKHRTTTTMADRKAARHPDLIKRAWGAPVRPDQWWAADFTYVWTLAGFCYVSFVTDLYSRRILGWRVSTSKATPLVISALDQALFTRRRADAHFTSSGLVFHSDAGSQAVHRHSLHHRPRRCRDRSLHRHRRRRPGQRRDGVDHRAVQDRADRAASPHLVRGRRGRTRDRQLGPLVQHDQDPQLDRPGPAGRIRSRLGRPPP